MDRLAAEIDSAFRQILAGKEPHYPSCPGCDRCLNGHDTKPDRSYPNAPDIGPSGSTLKAGT